MRPRITIVTPSYNQAGFIEETLLSVLGQGYPNLQYIVIDGGSTDGALAIIDRYRERLSTVISEPDRGQSDAINKGFRLADGDLVAWINSDDLLLPGALDTWADAYEKDPGALAWAGKVKIIDAHGTELRIQEQRTGSADLMAQWLPDGAWIFQQGCAFSRQALQQVGMLREDLHYVMDVEFFTRFARSGRIALLPDVVGAYRIHDQAKTSRDVLAREAEHLGWLVSERRNDLAEAKFWASSAGELQRLCPSEWLLWQVPLTEIARHLFHRIVNGVRRRLVGTDARRSLRVGPDRIKHR